jgi:hypothetical protein
MSGRILVALILATAGEVAGLAYWLHFLRQDAWIASFLCLIAGEAVEWSLLAALIVKSTADQPTQRAWRNSTLLKTAIIIFSESLLWVCWFAAIGRLGFAVATMLLFVLMHIKHSAAIAVYTRKSISADLFDPISLTATVLEVAGAAIFYQLVLSGHMAAGVAVLAVCITIEHTLQFRAAGLLHTEGSARAFS